MNNLTINNLVLMPMTNTIPDQYARSYNINSSMDSLRNLENMFDTNSLVAKGTNKIKDIDVVNNDLIDLQTIGEYAHIPNGWNTNRLKFMLTATTTPTNRRVKQTCVIQGFTSHYEPSLSGSLDRMNMKFYMNTITILNTTYNHNGIGTTIKQGSINIVKDYNGDLAFEAIDSESKRLIRPSDVFENMKSDIDKTGLGDTRINLTDRLESTPKEVNTSNLDSASYISSIINNYSEARSTAGLGSNEEDIYDTAHSYTLPDNIFSLPFIVEIFNLNNTKTPTEFNLSTLDLLDPNTDNVTTLIDPSKDIGVRDTPVSLDSDDVMSTEQPTVINIKTTLLNNNIKSYMFEATLVSYTAIISNNVIGGKLSTEVIGASSALGSIPANQLSPYVEYVNDKIKRILGPNLTDNNQTCVDIIVDAKIFDCTNISISLNNEPSINYRFPTFADGVTSPVVTTATNSDNLINKIRYMLNSTYSGDQIYGLNEHSDMYV